MGPFRSVVVLPLVLVASMAQAQVEPRFDGKGLDAATRSQVEAFISTAREAGLPTEPLIDFALEGARKEGAGQAIVDGVRKRVGFLTVARDMLTPATATEIAAGAGVVQRGVSPEALRQLRRDRPRAELTEALGVIENLAGRGVPRETAAAVVIALANSGMRDADLREFRQTVERDIALGIGPAAAATTRANALTGSPDQSNTAGTTRGPTTGRIVPPKRP